MNASASNALLKPLEEPTSSTRIVLITDRPDKLPVTILSRCYKIVVAEEPDLALSDLRHMLGENAPKTNAPLKKAITHADGNPTLAAAIIHHNLAPWIAKVEKYLDGELTSPPLPVVTGKNATPVSVSVRILQTLLINRMKAAPETSLQTTIDTAWFVASQASDIDRTGIDAKTRLHVLLVEAQSATQQ